MMAFSCSMCSFCAGNRVTLVSHVCKIHRYYLLFTVFKNFQSVGHIKHLYREILNVQQDVETSINASTSNEDSERMDLIQESENYSLGFISYR